jgi:hypothetical protein
MGTKEKRKRRRQGKAEKPKAAPEEDRFKPNKSPKTPGAKIEVVERKSASINDGDNFESSRDEYSQTLLFL